MDISNRNVHTQAAAPGVQAAPGAPTGVRRNGSNDDGKWGRIGLVAAVLAVVILLIGVILSTTSSSVKPESKYVDSGRLQAVFLNTGQVYFGNVKSLNNKYLVLSNIYYLQTSGGSNGSSATSSSSSNVTLVKLGCELHEPLDQMVINRDQVTFWENLGENGQVAKAVSDFEKKNPDGQKCTDQSSSASTSSGSTTQNAGTSNTNSTTNSSTNTTKP